MTNMSGAKVSDNTGRGILLALVATLVFSTQDATSKFLVTSISPFQMTMMRFWAFAAFSLILVLRQGPIREAFRSRQPVAQVLRALLLLADIWMYMLALRTVHL